MTTPPPRNRHMEVIHHPDSDKTVFMPYAPAIKIKSGRDPVAIRQHFAPRLPRPSPPPRGRPGVHAERSRSPDPQGHGRHPADARRGARDLRRHRAHVRPQSALADGDIGRAHAIIDEYFASYDHRPTATNLAVLELGEPEQLIEIQMFPVVD